MARPRIGPDKSQLKLYLAQGLTHQQIVDQWFADSGVRLSRSTVSMAVARHELDSANPRPSYPHELPWVVAEEHRYHPDARMLRLEGRSRAGGKLNPDQKRALDNWKQELEEQDAVVHYERDTDEGFFWIPRQPEHGDDLVDRTNAVKG